MASSTTSRVDSLGMVEKNFGEDFSDCEFVEGSHTNTNMKTSPRSNPRSVSSTGGSVIDLTDMEDITHILDEDVEINEKPIMIGKHSLEDMLDPASYAWLESSSMDVTDARRFSVGPLPESPTLANAPTLSITPLSMAAAGRLSPPRFSLPHSPPPARLGGSDPAALSLPSPLVVPSASAVDRLAMILIPLPQSPPPARLRGPHVTALLVPSVSAVNRLASPPIPLPQSPPPAKAVDPELVAIPSTPILASFPSPALGSIPEFMLNKASDDDDRLFRRPPIEERLTARLPSFVFRSAEPEPTANIFTVRHHPVAVRGLLHGADSAKSAKEAESRIKLLSESKTPRYEVRRSSSFYKSQTEKKLDAINKMIDEGSDEDAIDEIFKMLQYRPINSGESSQDFPDKLDEVMEIFKMLKSRSECYHS
ncbi:hypothetical protein NA57DRAFT_81303 [Rhizodiscina lignyota]|uniref:Uncharacterized protein n=1 Tax=Rhizodiscina lignyota TaxID=1504668 RepID=A0A9P4I428_9PEZI|nr:hypothetical protein NA57DRAFT_81303 [Rhizodiscina lignyota]